MIDSPIYCRPFQEVLPLAHLEVYGCCGVGTEYCSGTSQAPIAKPLVTDAPSSLAPVIIATSTGPTIYSGTASFLVSTAVVVMIQTIIVLHIQ